MARVVSDNGSSAAAILSSVLENIRNLPVSSSSSASPSASSFQSAPRDDYARLFGRQKPVHDLLGGGHSADVLLWRKKNLSAGFLAVGTVIWVLFEWIGYHFISVVSLLLLVVLVALFAWSYGASILNRDPPPVPKFELSDETVLKVARVLTVEANRYLAILHEIAIGKDVVRFSKLAGVLLLLVLFGSWFQFLTLLYLATIAAHTLPVLYEKNEETIDRFAQRALNELQSQYRKMDASMLSKIPRGPAMQRRAD